VESGEWRVECGKHLTPWPLSPSDAERGNHWRRRIWAGRRGRAESQKGGGRRVESGKHLTPWPLSPSDAERGTAGGVGSGRVGVGGRSHKKAEGGGRRVGNTSPLTPLPIRCGEGSGERRVESGEGCEGKLRIAEWLNNKATKEKSCPAWLLDCSNIFRPKRHVF
jgi:hypothetical protein